MSSRRRRAAPAGLRRGQPIRTRASLASYVLHRYDWSESSLILDLFTRERAAIAVAAKGAKRPYSQLRGVLLPFQRMQVSLGRQRRRRRRRATCRRCAAPSGPAAQPMLTGAALFSGFYLNELLMKLLARHDPHAALFDAYAGDDRRPRPGEDAQAQAALRAFELVLLREIGLLPDLATETATQRAVGADAPLSRCSPTPASSSARPTTTRPPAARRSSALQAALRRQRPAALQRVAAGALGRAAAAAARAASLSSRPPQLRTRQVMLEAQTLELASR